MTYVMVSVFLNVIIPRDGHDYKLMDPTFSKNGSVALPPCNFFSCHIVYTDRGCYLQTELRIIFLPCLSGFLKTLVGSYLLYLSKGRRYS